MRGVEQKRVKGLVVELTHREAVPGAVAGAEDKSAFAGGEGREKFLVVVEIVFEVGVLNQNEVAGGAGEGGTDGVAFAAGFIFQKERYAWMAAVGLDDGAGAVGGITFEKNQFDLPAGDGFGDDGVERGAERRSLIENGDDDGERERCGRESRHALTVVGAGAGWLSLFFGAMHQPGAEGKKA